MTYTPFKSATESQFIAKLAEGIDSCWAKIEHIDNVGTRLDVPQIKHLLGTVITDRGGKIRFLKQARKNATEDTAVLMERIQWHVYGRASLWGPMISSMRVDQDRWNSLDTLATLIGMIGGRKSATDRWREALGA